MGKERPVGSRRLSHNGYVVIKTAMGIRRWPFEHRVVWENANGPIPPKAIIHHRNEIKTDNRIENLELCLDNGKAHLREKHLSKFRTPEFRAAVSARFKGKKKNAETCKRISEGLKKVKALPASLQEEILTLRRSGLSMMTIGKTIDKSTTTVFRYLRSHGDVIPVHLKKNANWKY